MQRLAGSRAATAFAGGNRHLSSMSQIPAVSFHGQVISGLGPGGYMSGLSKRTLFWTPRALSILLIIFLSLFALDVFEENVGFWRTLQALSMHLIPSLVLTGALILAWRWEWVGALTFGGAGGLYIATLLSRPQPPIPIKLHWIAVTAFPAFLIAALFLANWLKHDQLRVRG
jgi:hypothetical protein